MGLHICIFSIVDLLEAVYGQLLYLVYHFATSVVALAGVALCIFVCANASHCVHNALAYIVF